jgi:hypothetical protein
VTGRKAFFADLSSGKMVVIRGTYQANELWLGTLTV